MKQELLKQKQYSKKAEAKRKELMLTDSEYRENRLAWRRANYAKNKETIRAAVKADRADNPDKYRKSEKKYRDSNKDKYYESKREYRNFIRNKVFKHYGGKCKCCAESTVEFLAIDHKNRDGAKHRKELMGSNEAGGSHRMRLWIIKNNFPKTFQLLCHNCNIGRERNNGVCPHKLGKR